MARRLNIKNLVPRKGAEYRQGYYKLINPSKYIGDPEKIIFRSSWEKKFATYCDLNERVISWSSEPFPIPYFNPIDNVTRPYNVDFYVKVQNGEGYSEYIVEVKPSRQLKRPVQPTGKVSPKRLESYNNAMKTYIVNAHKFQAAKEFAKGRGWQFVVVTENFIF